MQLGTQTRFVQANVPCEFEHTSPQAEQLLVVPSVVSQPLPGLLSQLPKPVVQVPSVHVPVLQLALALAREHPTLQSPQSVFVVTLRSQPLSGLPSQLLNPVLQVGEQS